MKYSEFKESIHNLGKDYDVNRQDNQNPDYIYVTYKGNDILDVSKCTPFSVETYHFNECPKKQEVWDLATKLAATPLNERKEERKYNVIIGEDKTSYPCVGWSRNALGEYLLDGATFEHLQTHDYCQFTDSEFKDLIKYIKTLPDGEFQAKVAEHGKRLVKGDDE